MCEDFTGGNSCGKVKEFKLPQAVQGPLRRRWSFSLILSLSLVQECILPKNWPFFRSRTNDHTAQCLTHGNPFLRLCVNDYNCNKSCLGTSFSRLVPLITQQQYILPRTRSPWLIFCQSYFMMDALGKGLVELLEPWSILFIYFPQLVENCIRPIWMNEVGTLLPSSDVYVRGFLCPATLNKIFHTKLWVTETSLWSWD